MSFDRDLWKRSFLNDAIPPFPCPSCAHGHLVLVQDSLRELQPTHNSQLKDHDAWEPVWIRTQFVLFLQCTIRDCGEVVAVCGETKLLEVAGEEDYIYLTRLIPAAMVPAPPIIDVPAETPMSVTDCLKAAFGFFWNDNEACASRLRTSVERIMDDLKIPTERLTKKGKTTRMDLSERIEKLRPADQDNAETMDALRYVGNLGAHGGHVEAEALLDSFLIYEHALAELYGKRTEKVKTLRAKIIAAKGKYEPPKPWSRFRDEEPKAAPEPA